MIRSSTLLFGLWLWLCVTGITAATAAPRVTSVLILPDGPQGADLLLSNAEDSLREQNIGVTEFDDATLAGFDLKAARDCLGDEAAEDCSDVLNMVPAEWVLVLGIRRESDNPDSDQSLVAKLYSAKTADLLQIERRVCQRCSSSERMATMIRELVTEMTMGQLAEKARDTFLDVQSSPAGVVLSIDGTVVGPTGQSYRVAPGEHSIKLQYKGYRTATQTVTVSANEHKAMTVTLDAKPKPDGTRRMLGWLSIGAGSLAAVGGTVQVLRHEEEAPAGARPHEGQLDTKNQGIAGLAIGAALIGVGTALILTAESGEEEDSSALTVSATPTPHGLAFGLAGSF
ncbi:MAG: PEGA domain-containing protein [Myxococcales bacterium]|nr:PEGA domain-containing protein [Myxococcales bacterium]